MLEDLSFYKDYFGTTIDKATELKIKRIKAVVKDDKIYKFILFDDNIDLNNVKLKSLESDNLCFSHYIYLNDPTEFELKYDIKKVANKSGVRKENIKLFVDSIKEIYDVCSFTYEYSSDMWKNYANNGRGICLVFEVQDYDMLFPVDYIDKWKINYSKLLIDSYKRQANNEWWGYSGPMSLLPFVTKNPMNGELDSTKEKELRILYSPFDEGLVNDGYLYPNVKRDTRYVGSNVSYDYCKLKLSQIIIGTNCDDYIRKSIAKIYAAKNIALLYEDYS